MVGLALYECIDAIIARWQSEEDLEALALENLLRLLRQGGNTAGTETGRRRDRYGWDGTHPTYPDDYDVHARDSMKRKGFHSDDVNDIIDADPNGYPVPVDNPRPGQDVWIKHTDDNGNSVFIDPHTGDVMTVQGGGPDEEFQH